MYLKNIGDHKITTSRNGWNLVANGLKYEHDASTFNSSLGSQNIEIVEGGDIEIKIVYLVKGHITHAQLQYDEPGIGGWALQKLAIMEIKVHYELGKVILLMLHTLTVSNLLRNVYLSV